MYHSFIIATLLFLRKSLIHRSDFSVHLRRMQYLTGFSKQKERKGLRGGTKAAFALVRRPRRGKEAQLQLSVSQQQPTSRAPGPGDARGSPESISARQRALL